MIEGRGEMGVSVAGGWEATSTVSCAIVTGLVLRTTGEVTSLVLRTTGEDGKETEE